MSKIEAAEKKLRVQLNYGGIVHDPADHKLIMEYRQGDKATYPMKLVRCGDWHLLLMNWLMLLKTSKRPYRR